MSGKNKKYIITQSGELYVKVDEQFYKQYPDNRLVLQQDIQNIRRETNDPEEAVYDCCCVGCVHEKWCHEECEHRCTDDEDSSFNQMTAYVDDEDL